MLLFINNNFNLIAGHVENGNEIIDDKYTIQFAITPQILHVNESTLLTFSIQNPNGEDIHQVQSKVQILFENNIIYESNIFQTGDFEINTTFSNSGNYQIILIIIEQNQNIINNFEFFVYDNNPIFDYVIIIFFVFIILLILVYLLKKSKR
tara:strand:+ start:696 stop:1148 length:453 start_codon:yes stop_codon:yes gene_type:complete